MNDFFKKSLIFAGVVFAGFKVGDWLFRKDQRGLGATRAEFTPIDPFVHIFPSTRRSEMTAQDHIDAWLVAYSRNPKKATKIMQQGRRFCEEASKGDFPNMSREFRVFMRDRGRQCIKAMNEYERTLEVRRSRAAKKEEPEGPELFYSFRRR